MIRAWAAATISLFGLAPALSAAWGWLFVLMLVTSQLALGPSASPLPRLRTARRLLLSAVGRWREFAVALAFASGAAGAVLAEPKIVARAWDELTTPSSPVVLIALALLAATLAWGVVVETSIALFSARLETIEEGVAAGGIRHAGRVIGWLSEG